VPAERWLLPDSVPAQAADDATRRPRATYHTRMNRPDSSDAFVVRGRPRGFDAQASLLQAIEVFRRRGYEATSIDDLTRELGINRSSFYACFGSKHALLLAAVDTYCARSLLRFDAILARGGTPPRRIEALLKAIVEPEAGRSGCFLHNCIGELAPTDVEIDARVMRHVAALRGRLRHTLDETNVASPGRVADALLAAALGALSMRKAGASPRAIRSVLRTCTDALLAEAG